MRRVLLKFADWLQALAGPDGAYAVGRKYARERKFDLAIDIFSQAELEYVKRLGPTSPRVVDAMAQRAYCLVALGRLPEGVELYERALEAKLVHPDGGPPPLDQLRSLVADARQRLGLDQAQSRGEGG